jgi:hypothetical protein|tara:strand:+ start:269 stop:472 length:204 start_codon:yes stop_codon:yes gene_type:complete
MSHIIKPKRSEVVGSVPESSDLATHELAMNVTDKKIFTKAANGSIITISSGGGTSEDDVLALAIALG